MIEKISSKNESNSNSPNEKMEFVLSLSSTFLILLCCVVAVVDTENESTSTLKKFTPGHLEKLGAHCQPQGITVTGRFLSPPIFYGHFVYHAKPVLMKEVLQQVSHPGLTNWTDSFLSNAFGEELVRVEQSKKENRKLDHSDIPFKEFLSIYKTADVYMVQSLRDKMRGMIQIPSTLQCGGFHKVIQDSVLWMGSHHTSSVLHRDPLDNLLCVLSGHKEIVLIDKGFKNEVERDGFDPDGMFSHVDPESVDFDMFPGLAQIRWHTTTLQKGDCLYIPEGWYHQVTSGGVRHMSINLWFSHLWWFNSTDCDLKDKHHNNSKLETYATFRFASPNESYRSKLLSGIGNKGIVTRLNIHQFLHNSPSTERSTQFFNAINEFTDGAISWSEFYSFDIDKILMQFPDIFGLTGKTRKEKDASSLNQDKQGSNLADTHVEADIEEEKKLTGDDMHKEGSLPLPDSVSGDSPSLPDDSLHDVSSVQSTTEDSADEVVHDATSAEKGIYSESSQNFQDHSVDASNHFEQKSNDEYNTETLENLAKKSDANAESHKNVNEEVDEEVILSSKSSGDRRDEL